MFEDVAIFIIILTGMGLVAWLLHTVISNRHRARLEPADGLGAVREVQLLSSENAGLKGQVGRLEERIATLERIATDPAERTAREIEQLR
jgi:hypothetical protein